MMIRNADGTVDHDGEYNPWLELDAEKEQECRASGGFVMRIGTAYLGRPSIGILKDGTLQPRAEPTRYKGDGLMYVSFA